VRGVGGRERGGGRKMMVARTVRKRGKTKNERDEEEDGKNKPRNT